MRDSQRARRRLVLGFGAAALGAPTARAAEGPTMAPPPLATLHPALHLVGDSTVAEKALDPLNPERGWGQLLREWMREPARLLNHGRNGRSTKSFRELGHWDHVLAQLAAGDWVLLQFGHNDQKADDPLRYAPAQGAFKDNLQRYLDELRARGALPLLATPVVRRSFDASGRVVDSHADYPEVVRTLAAGQNVPLLEMYGRTRAWLQQLGPEASKAAFQWLEPGRWQRYPEGRRDDTHYSESGARAVAALAVAEIRRLRLPIAAWLLDAPRRAP